MSTATEFNPFLDEGDHEERLLLLREVPDETVRKLASGTYRLEKKKSAPRQRKRFTAKDLLVLEWTKKFRFTSASHLGILLGVKADSAYKRLLQLEASGLMRKLQGYAPETQWTLTLAGARFIGEEAWRVKTLPESTLHSRIVGFVAANLAAGHHGVLGAPEGKRLAGTIPGPEGLTSEYAIQRSLAYMRTSFPADGFRTGMRRELRARFEEWQPGEPDPGWVEGEEWASVLVPQFNGMGAYHVPDLVIRRPRVHWGRPGSWAVEVEASVKKEREYRRILEVYLGDFQKREEDGRIYGGVLWLCRSPKAVRMLSAAADRKGILGTKVKVELLRNSAGEPLRDDEV